MQRLKSVSVVSFVVVLSISVFLSSTLAQSGRGRPKVPGRETAAPPPPPPNIPAAAAVVKQEQSANILRFALQNGTSIVISEQHAHPLVAAVVCVKIKSPDQRSTARLLERLVLSATSNINADLQSLGALAGSHTSLEGTFYYAVAPPDKIDGVLARLADAIRKPSFDEAEMRRSVSLLVEEDKRDPDSITGISDFLSSNKSYDNYTSAYAMSRLYELAFADNAIGQSKLGEESLKSITKEQLTDFHNKLYRPENLVVTVVGDVVPFNVRVLIQQLFGELGVAVPPAATKARPDQKASARPVATQTKPASQTPNATPAATLETQEAAKPAPLPEASKLRYAADRGDLSQSIVSVGYRTDDLAAKDRAVVEVLSAILGKGRGSRLQSLLVDGQSVATHVETDYQAFSKDGFLTVQMWAAANLIDKAESAFFREAARLRSEMVGESEIVRAKMVLEKHHVGSTKDYMSRAYSLACAEAFEGGFRASTDYVKAIRAVTAQDVQRVAAKYFILSNTSLHEYEAAGATPRTFDTEGFARTATAWVPEIAQPVQTKDVRAADDRAQPSLVTQNPERTAEEIAAFESVQPLPVKDFSTLNGARAFVREDRSQPDVTIALLFMGGRSNEDEKNSGITEMMLRLALYGAGRRTLSQVVNELEQYGAEVEVVAEPDTFGFIVSVLSRNADRALRIVREVIEEPTFRDEDLERARAVQIGMIRRDRDSHFTRSRELLYQSLFSGHPYSLPSHGREEVVSKLTIEQIRQWHERTIKRQFPLAIVVGDTQGSALISGTISDGFRRRDVDKTIQLRIPKPAPPSEKIEQRRQPISASMIGFIGPRSESRDLDALDVIEATINSRLISELNAKQVFARTAKLDTEALLTAGAVYAYLETSPEDEQRARFVVMGELERMMRGLGAEDLESARAVAITRKLARLQSQRENVFEYARLVLNQKEASSLEAFADTAAKITAEDIKRVATQYFKPAGVYSGILRGASSPAPQQPNKQE